MAAVVAAWERRLQRLYGLPPGGYDALLAAQGGVCAACGKRPGRRSRLAVDHDHQTGAIRGLLHPRCNRALAPWESSIESIQRVINYLYRCLAVRLFPPLVPPLNEEELSDYFSFKAGELDRVRDLVERSLQAAIAGPAEAPARRPTGRGRSK